ncbi:hypothetical protein [Bacillus thuringiensis]|uniref:hypothetical protein n=1 Tax=Bacillus thuringiensis TaxID=1428 RepID=UPI0011550246|nr:hypothetical protein [Bacillus thuringiensis]
MPGGGESIHVTEGLNSRRLLKTRVLVNPKTVSVDSVTKFKYLDNLILRLPAKISASSSGKKAIVAKASKPTI